MSQPATFDDTCPICRQMILGIHGRRSRAEVQEIDTAVGLGERDWATVYVHPADTIDDISQIPSTGEWAHTYCVEERAQAA